MKVARYFKAAAAFIVVAALSLVLLLAIFGWNWLRAPIERMVLERTGRALVITGDLTMEYAWPRPRLRAGAVSFANPAWATERQMVTAQTVEVSLDLPQLLARKIVFPEVRLQRPVLFLEKGSAGKKNWLLDLQQQDEGARFQIDRLSLDEGSLGYDDAAQKTRIRATLSTQDLADGAESVTGLVFQAEGQFKGLALKAHGGAGPVLALREQTKPYPLLINAQIGPTTVQASGTVTDLASLAALDMRLKLHGASLEQLYPLLGIAVPETAPYALDGHLLHSAGKWRYEEFSGVIGKTDIAGNLQLLLGGKRPALSATLVSKRLVLTDLGPVIGARPGRVQAARQAAQPLPVSVHVLPDLPFKFERWDSVDAEVDLHAKSIERAKELPLENLVAHLSLRDSVVKLAPLDFGLAGGELQAVITLDGRQSVIQAHAKVGVKKILVSKLFPTVALNETSLGQVNGEFDLSGRGNSVGRMLAAADGSVWLVVQGGSVSKLLMEKAGLHLWEILQIKLTGDRPIKLRCVVADFAVSKGRMQTQALVFDTEVTTLIGTGNIDLAQEQLDLTLNQKTKNTSPLALRSPIYLRGSFAKPQFGVDQTRMAVRALGALALGIASPLLAIIPLIDAGPGQDSDCAQLVHDARDLQPANANKTGAKK
jgi:uncharacterized protein involved in outer membrane biogenesis